MPLGVTVLCVVFSGCLVAGQILFKLAAEDIKLRLAAGAAAQAVLSPWLIGALGLYAATTALWIYILTRAPLNLAYPFSLLGAALVPTVAHLVFGEAMTWRYVAGLLLVIAGLAVIQLPVSGDMRNWSFRGFGGGTGLP
jgi:drug/metabolite transporter (DMT)-like permease